MLRTIPALALLALLLAPAVAFGDPIPGPGDAVPVPDGPSANALNLYLMVLGGLVPLVGYVLNHYAPWASDPEKGVVHAALAAGVAVLYQAVTPSDLGLNDETLLAALTAMASAVFAHVGYSAARINVALGGGSNRRR